RGPALPPLHGEAPVRARLLVGLRQCRSGERRLLAAPHGGDRRPLPARGPPRRHGRGLLLGRLPPGLDPPRAAPLAPPPPGGRGLVAQPEDGRAPTQPLRRGNEAVERGDRRAARLRPLRHRAADRRAHRLDHVRSVAYDHFYAYEELSDTLRSWAEEAPSLC